jgi:hypothetical protein
MRSTCTAVARATRRGFRSAAFALALALPSACSSTDPRDTFSAAASTAASARMLVDARVQGHVTHSYAVRLLEAERREAHTLAAQLRYESVPRELRDVALSTMNRLGLVLDELASEQGGDLAAISRDAASLDTLASALDSLSASTARR